MAPIRKAVPIRRRRRATTARPRTSRFRGTIARGSIATKEAFSPITIMRAAAGVVSLAKMKAIVAKHYGQALKTTKPKPRFSARAMPRRRRRTQTGRFNARPASFNVFAASTCGCGFGGGGD